MIRLSHLNEIEMSCAWIPFGKPNECRGRNMRLVKIRKRKKVFFYSCLRLGLAVISASPQRLPKHVDATNAPPPSRHEPVFNIRWNLLTTFIADRTDDLSWKLYPLAKPMSSRTTGFFEQDHRSKVSQPNLLRPDLLRGTRPKSLGVSW
jgi:hypothetical protein